MIEEEDEVLIPVVRHDAFFCGMMSDETICNEIVKLLMKPAKLRNFNLNELVSASAINISEKLRKKIPDVSLFYYGDVNVVWCIHIEHQSRNDKNISKRILDYQIAISRTYKRSFPDDPREIAICSILFQASKKPYDGTCVMILCVDENGNIVEKKFDVFDLAKMSYEEIDTLGIAAFVLMPMKYMVDGNPRGAYLYAVKNKAEIIELTRTESFEMIQNYILTSLSKNDRIEVMKVDDEYTRELEVNMETWANSYANEVARKKYKVGFGNGEKVGFGKGEEVGFGKGVEAVKLFVLRKMVDDDVDMGQVQRYLGLSDEELALYLDIIKNDSK